MELKKGETIMIDATLHLPAACLHEAFSDRCGFPPDHFELYYRGKRLEGEAALSSWGVGKDSTIEVKMRGRGGAPGTSPDGACGSDDGGGVGGTGDGDGAEAWTSGVAQEREDITSSPETSSDLVKLCAGGLTDGRAAYDLVQRAASDPAAKFWERWASQELHWFHDALGAWLSQSTDGGWTGWNVDGSPTTLDSWQPWETAVDASEAPHVRWFCGARTNAAFNEVDRHVLRGHGSEVAFIAESPSGETTRITRRWLLLHSVLIAHALQNGLRVTAPQRIALCRLRVKRQPL